MNRVAIYARKSTAQPGADADATSVAVQVANARAFATAKGWTVTAVYTDEAVSGADAKRLVQRERLLTAIRGGNARVQPAYGADRAPAIVPARCYPGVTPPFDRSILLTDN